MSDDARIWIGGLPDGISEDEIKDEFKKYGEVEGVQLRSNPGAPTFAFVQYGNRHDAEDAISGANQAKLFGQAFVKVSWAGKNSKGKGKGKGKNKSRSRSRSRRSRSRSNRSRSRRRSPSRKRSPSRRNDRDRSRGGDRQRSPPRRPPTPPPRREPSRRRSRDRSPPRRSRSQGYKGNPSNGNPGTKGKYRVCVEKLPEDMGWQELKDVGSKLAKYGKCTFARTNRDATGVLEFTDSSDMAYAIKELDGRRFSGDAQRMVAYEEGQRR